MAWEAPVPAGSRTAEHSHVTRFLQRQTLTHFPFYLPGAKGTQTSSKWLGTVFRLRVSRVPSGCWWVGTELPALFPS